MKKSKKQSITVLIVVGVLFIVLTAVIILSSIMDRVKMNPSGTIGNSAGNLNNGGFFCEYDGKVYFANAYQGGAMYSMNPDETGLKRINNSECRNILAGGEYLYYFQMGASGDSGFGSVRIPRSFNRCDLDGKNISSLTRDTVVTGQLVDNYLYLLIAGDEHPSFYKMKIDKSDKEVLAEYVINPACAVDGTIYYNGTQDNHFLYALNTSNDVSNEVFQANLWYPIVDGNYVYYMDVGNNYRICRYSMAENVAEVLTEDRIDCYNEKNGYIYYQTVGKNPQLVMMQSDGYGKTTIAEGVYHNINITSNYVYFQKHDDDSKWYHSPLGASYYEEFSAAQNAAD